MARHTTLPWAADGQDVFSPSPKLAVATCSSSACYGTSGGREIPYGQAEANAAYIALACNSHVALVKSLKTLVDNAARIEHDSYIMQGHEAFQPEKALKAARAALLKAGVKA